MRPRRFALVLLLVLVPLGAATACGGGGSKNGAATLTATAPTQTLTTQTKQPPRPGKKAKIAVTLTGQTHHPKVNGRWSYTVRVTDAAGKPIPAKIHLQVLFAGVPVGQIGRHEIKNGVWHETIGAPGNPPFPPASRGRHLVFQAVVTADGVTVKRDWPITPQ